MNIAIIEDEYLAASKLQRMIAELVPDATIAATLSGVREAAQWFQVHPMPDLVICDINLNDGTAFDLLDRVPITAPLIFTTAHDEFALQAHKVRSIDYLLKPIKKSELQAALGKLDEWKLHFQKIETKAEPYKSRFMIRIGDLIKSIEVHEVGYFYADNKSTFLKTKDNRALPIDVNLDNLEQVLDPTLFFRINRKFIISIGAVAHMRAHTKGRVIIQLQPNYNQPTVVSAERAANFKQWLNGELM